MQMSRTVLILVALIFGWLCLSLWFRLATIDATTARTMAQVNELQQRMDELDERVSTLNDDLGQAASSINRLHPELVQNLSEVKTLLETTLPAMRADLDRLSGASSPGRR
jgi:chromosome segregation ATPase